MTDDGIVLVPLDETPIAEGALPYASALAKALGAGIRLLLVQHRHERGVGAPERGKSWNYLEAVAGRLGARGSLASTAIEQGEPVEGILSAAERPDVALVVMATHGRGGLERWIEGSVADAVMRTCAKPTLLIVPSDLADGPRDVNLQRIMVPLDGSPLAAAALPLAEEIARGCGATLTLVKALSRMGAPGTFVPNLEEWEADEIEAARAYLETVRSRLPASLPSEALVLVGLSPASLLSQFAEAQAVDLVIMSTHGYGGFRRLTLGSVADRLVRSGVPALLVRPPMAVPPGVNGTPSGKKTRKALI